MKAYDVVKFLHILTAVFMAAPLYNLIVVNERARFGKAHLQVDLYFENLIRANALRCYVFQLTVLATGLLLIALRGALSTLVTNWVLLSKFVILLLLTGLLSVVQFSIQPRIDKLLTGARGDAIAPSIAEQVGPLRVRRKRLAAVCLFLLITAVLLGLQVYVRFAAPLTVLLVVAAALYAWRVYSTRIAYGWA